MGMPKETTDRVTPEREPLERKIRERTSDSEREDVVGEELPQVLEDREPKTVLSLTRGRMGILKEIGRV